MATYSKGFTGGFSGYTLYLELTEKSYDIQTNTSTVYYKLYIKSTKALQYGAWDYSASNTAYSITLDGNTPISGYKTYDFRDYQTLDIASGTVMITHNEDGTMPMSFSASYGAGDNSIGTASLSGIFNLTTIPRASEISCATPSAMASSQTVTVTQKSISFSHILYYSTDSETFTEIGRGTATKDYTWTLPDISDNLPNADSATYTLKCETFTNGNYEGDPLTSTLAVTATVPASYIPTVTIGTITEGNSAVPSGFPFIVGYTKPIIPLTFTGSHNSTVASRTVTANGETQTSASTDATVSFTMQKALTALSTPLSAVAVDSRGRQGTAAQSITAHAYTAPSLEIDCTRCDQDGTINALGEYALIMAKWSWQSITNGAGELNGASIKIYVNGTLTATYNTATDSQTTLSQIAILSNISDSQQYTIKAEITDALATATVSQLITKAQMPLSLYDDGTDIGVTIGRMATQGGFHVNLDQHGYSNMKFIFHKSDGTMVEHDLAGLLFDETGGTSAEGEVGTNNYNELVNKPQINSVELIGNRNLDELNIQIKGDYADTALTNTEIENLIESFV